MARKEGDKKADIFTLVLDQTVETEWFYLNFIKIFLYLVFIDYICIVKTIKL